MLNAIFAECHIQALNVECHYAQCCYAECRGALVDTQPGQLTTSYTQKDDNQNILFPQTSNLTRLFTFPKFRKLLTIDIREYIDCSLAQPACLVLVE
jgi:hypothetical protein